MTLLLTTGDTERLITTREAIDALDEAYKAICSSEATHRIRSDMVVALSPEEDYWLATMEGAIRPMGVASIRLRSDHKVAGMRHGVRTATKYAQRPGLYCGLVILYSLDTAEPLAIINDGYLQVMRVGATSALAGKYLARPDSSTLGVIGASNQARGHIRAFAALFPLEDVKVYSRTPEERARFADEMAEELGLPVRAVDSAEEAVRGSDIVAGCTSSRVPILEEDWIEDGTYTCSIRYFHEFGLENVRRMDIHAVHPAVYGPLLWAGPRSEDERSPMTNEMKNKAPLPEGTIPVEEIIGGLKPGRTDGRQRTFFNNHSGMGIQFTALGKIVYDRARERGMGRELPTEWLLQDIST